MGALERGLRKGGNLDGNLSVPVFFRTCAVIFSVNSAKITCIVKIAGFCRVGAFSARVGKHNTGVFKSCSGEHFKYTVSVIFAEITAMF